MLSKRTWIILSVAIACVVITAIVLIVVFVGGNSENGGSRLVETEQGPVIGYIMTPNGGVFEFYSIPYATVPTGTNRFKAPLSPPVWTTPFEAVNQRIICPQQPHRAVGFDVREDCLIANIFVPDTEETNLPVAIYVHGGGYHAGHGLIGTPINLVRDHNIIVITFNYRLGAYGYLCLGTEDAPGNAGSKDQVAMLRWVKENIASFGGNPNDVTIAGYSGGASGVDLLQFSKMAEGLFNKVIPESGSNIASWSVQRDPILSAKNYAERLNFTNTDDLYALEEFYKTTPLDVLASLPFMDSYDSIFPFTPCLELDLGQEIFLDDDPVNILKDGNYIKVPLLYGFADKEGLLRYTPEYDYWLYRMNDHFSDFLPGDLQFDSTEQKEEVARTVRQFYFGDAAIGEETINGYVDYFTDVTFAYSTLRSLKLNVQAGNDMIYLYEYSFNDDSLPSIFGSHPDVFGASHVGQTQAVLDIPTEDESGFPDRVRENNAVMRELWSNFIKTGDPVPTGSSLPAWPPAAANGAPYMSLNETRQLRGALLEGRMLFWDAIYESHYRAPAPPSPVEPSDARVIQTAQGPVRGYRVPSGGLFVFYSIPYASVPTGENRFKAPLPPPVWTTPFEAVDQRIVCPQQAYRTVGLNVREDCLIANVYVPDTEETNLPVVVYVHGGGYNGGYGELASANNFARSRNLVVVTFNYRLGAYGYLCLGTEDAPGNSGSKDQVALLRWVKDNIASFGGNPNDVTIAGYSGGASGVDLLQLSKMTEGLISKVIPESGANLAVWSILQDPIQSAKNYAERLNFTNTDDFYALQEFYMTAPLDLITSIPFMDLYDSTIRFTPCLERDVGQEIFLDEAPVTLLKEGRFNRYPMLYGFADKEGLLRSTTVYEHWIPRMNEYFSDFLPGDLQFDSMEQKEQVARIVREFYFGDRAVADETINDYVDYFTDVTVAYGILRSLKLQVEAGNDQIYLYEYAFYDETLPDRFGFHPDVFGSAHCGQTYAVLDHQLTEDDDESSFSDRIRKMRAVTRELWSNFARTGTPVPTGSSLPAWPPAGANGAPYMSLNETLQLRGTLLEGRMLLWDEIYERHYRMPQPPPPPPPRNINNRK